MGWTSMLMPYNADKKKFLQEQLFRNSEVYEVLKSQFVGSVCYMAVRRNDLPKKDVFCAVILTSTKGRELFFKDLDETCEPYYYDCPKSILNLLTPTDYENAIRWRAECLKKHEQKKNKPKVKHGDKIKFDTPIKFSSGEVYDTFTIVKEGRRTYFTVDSRKNMYYTIRKWNNKQYEKLESVKNG